MNAIPRKNARTPISSKALRFFPPSASPVHLVQTKRTKEDSFMY